jgi:subtilisin family serine protease
MERSAALGLIALVVSVGSVPAGAGTPAPPPARPAPVFVRGEAYEKCLRALGSVKERPGREVACADPDWGFKQMRIQPAHDLLEKAGKRPGEGIWVGQIDTGYSLHPAVRDRLDLVKARNVLEPEHSARDTYSIGFFGWLTDGAWSNPIYRDPGHGTKTAGFVIGDPVVAKEPEKTGWVRGAAPHVTFIPVRGSKGPALGPIGQRQAAKGFCYLAGGRVGSKQEGKKGRCDPARPDETAGLPIVPLGRPVDVITVSRAAPTASLFAFNRSLRESLDFARDRGVIVAAASGDYKGIKAYPAQSCAVISVSSTIATGAPWWGSPHIAFKHRDGKRLPASEHCEEAGKLKVDVSGPGAGVWRAALAGKPGQFHRKDPFVYGVGKGTSFTTPVVASVAALWRQYHQHEDDSRTAEPTFTDVCTSVRKGVRDEVCEKYLKEGGVALVPYVFSYVVRKHGVRTPRDICADARENAESWGYTREMVEDVCREEKAPWDTHYGAGILDALRVLQAPLPDAGVVCADIRSRGGVPPKACEGQ